MNVSRFVVVDVKMYQQENKLRDCKVEFGQVLGCNDKLDNTVCCDILTFWFRDTRDFCSQEKYHHNRRQYGKYPKGYGEQMTYVACTALTGCGIKR